MMWPFFVFIIPFFNIEISCLLNTNTKATREYDKTLVLFVADKPAFSINCIPKTFYCDFRTQPIKNNFYQLFLMMIKVLIVVREKLFSKITRHL